MYTMTYNGELLGSNDTNGRIGLAAH